jgi:hypothetical protein
VRKAKPPASAKTPDAPGASRSRAAQPSKPAVSRAKPTAARLKAQAARTAKASASRAAGEGARAGGSAARAQARPARAGKAGRNATAAEKVPRQGFATEGERAFGPVQPPGGADFLATAAEIVNELTRASISTGERLIKDALSRLPL